MLGLGTEQFPSLCSFSGAEATSRSISDVRSAVAGVTVKVKVGEDTGVMGEAEGEQGGLSRSPP